MLLLTKLELKKNKISTYIVSSIIIAFVLLGLIYMFAYAPKIEPSDQDMLIFLGYRNVLSLYGAINMAVFSVLSSVMYCKFIHDEYTGKRVILLLSYPVSKVKIFLSKIIVVSFFTITAAFLTHILVVSIFMISELIIPIVEESLTISHLIVTVRDALVMAFLAAGIGIIAMAVGFFKKSVPTSIITSVIIASLFCNIAFNTLGNNVATTIVTILTITGATVASGITLRTIKNMEVE